MQLPLNIHMSEINRFSNFIPGHNEELVDSIENNIASLTTNARPVTELIFVWGGNGTGKTHLLQAACQQARELEIDSVYLPLGQAGVDQPGILEELFSLPLVCIDDVHTVAGQAEWEAALFNLYEGMRGRGMLLISSERALSECGFVLPDLASRLRRGLVYGLKNLDHEQRMQVLRQRAQLRGLTINDEVVAYIEKHFPRDMPSLGQLLERLDHESLVQQRKITIPLLKSILMD